MPRPEEALRLAREITATSTADETEVTIDSESDSFVRFADVGATQCGDRERIRIGIRVRRREAGGGYREARSVAGSTHAEDWKRALERALALMNESPPNEEALGLGGPEEVPSTVLDEATLAHGFESKAAWVEHGVRACADAGLQPAGLVRTGVVQRALVNSEGRSVHGATTRASFFLTASGDAGSGIAGAIAPRVTDLDAGMIVERAVEKSRRSQTPQPIEAGEYTVVLEPLAVSSILLFASYAGFGAREVHEQSSFLCGRLGQDVFASSVSIHDDAGDPALPGMPFDGEGNRKRRVELVTNGRLMGPVTDRIYAKKLGLECTGHAVPAPSSNGPMAENLVVAAGDRSVEELVAGIDRGLLVTQLHYTNMIEPRDLTLTGMTRNGTFLIEKGEIGPAVRNLRFTDTLVRAFSNVTGVGSEAEAAGALFDGEVVTPALRIDGFRFTSTTDF